MKTREVAVLVAFLAYLVFKYIRSPTSAAIGYAITSALFWFDSGVIPIVNHDGQIEEDKYIHRFIPVSLTLPTGLVNVTYHVVECGDESRESVVFYHGIIETWRAWKSIMKPLCASNYRSIAVDIEGQGQSTWLAMTDDAQRHFQGDIRTLQSKLQLELLNTLHIDKFNLIVSGYGFWTSLGMFTEAPERILRYGKLQSIVGVEDPKRNPFLKLIVIARPILDILSNTNPYAIARILLGKSLIRLPGLSLAKWSGTNEVDDYILQNVVLPEIRKGSFKGIFYSLVKGKDLVTHMTEQLDIFSRITCPVLILQGDADSSQPISLFDGSLEMKFISSEKSLFEKFSSSLHRNDSHVLQVVPSAPLGSDDPSLPVGRTATDYFRSSSWVKFRIVNGAGHFLTMEAPDTVIEAVEELLSVPRV